MPTIVATDYSEFSELFEAAASELPRDVIDQDQARAWIGKRILELEESARKKKRTTQVLLANWLANSAEYGHIWMDHPDGYETYRDFLNAVGTPADGNQLDPSVISEMVSIAEVITPYCRDHGITVDGYITTKLWTKLRETIPALKAAIVDDDLAMVQAILADVKALPNRDALRLKYRAQRSDKIAVADSISRNGQSVVVLAVPTAHLADVKRAVGRVADWNVIVAGTIADDHATLQVALPPKEDDV